ncbi:GDSL-type esterase/lipase family protein [Pseudogulbenkiania subflava]|uniref:Lysophospholipase L1 n=1 Tax=Pseudogulbenkiania subflava DSM 22618 TaxID=1123014 RepID=A0A1Y6BX92_9NEIS|nr:GDSL-type esterase/lipase family protein [Pseudogulbenkiania subflava]SMF24663.1 Lysophospholipase L1 [Pseudogulbenkiania subflava DSM 22618]
MRLIIVLLFLLTDAVWALAAPDEHPWEPHPRTADEPGNSAQEWLAQHESLLKLPREGHLDMVLLGDSITEGWDSAPEVWNDYFAGRTVANLGISGDTTQNLLWRITEGGELRGLSPKAVVLLVGTNNLDLRNDSAEDIALGIGAIVRVLHQSLPDSKVLILGIFPRGATHDAVLRQRIIQANHAIARLADGNAIHFLDIGTRFVSENGDLPAEVMPDAVHLSPKGYAIWADAMQPVLKALIQP